MVVISVERRVGIGGKRRIEEGWRKGVGDWGWEREVGIGGGRGVFWNFFFFEKRGGGGGRGGMGVVGRVGKVVLVKWV